LHFHLPPELDAMESGLRGVMKNGVARGHVQILGDADPSRAGSAAGLNRANCCPIYVRAFREAARSFYRCPTGQPDLNAALRMPGMLQMAGDAEARKKCRQARLEAGVQEARGRSTDAANAKARRRLVEMHAQRCRLLGLVARMEEIRAGAAPAFQKRLRKEWTSCCTARTWIRSGWPRRPRWLADRSDIAEELVRLKTHAAQVDGLLAGEGEVGKRLDFLLQEMNREANTILSKTGGLGDLGLTITDLAGPGSAKSEIDKIPRAGAEPQTRNDRTVFIISAPSGSGKSTLVSHLMADLPGLMFSISYTTRRPAARKGKARATTSSPDRNSKP
jgi:uncharacterized protein (TIGR00255 family)